MSAIKNIAEHLLAERDEARAEVERLREEISAVIADYGQMLMDGFNDCEAWEEAEARLSRALKRERSDD